MKLEPISKKIKPILDSIRDRIADDKGTEHVVENPSGWAYGGAEFLKDVESLRREIQAELKENSFQVNKALAVSPRKLLKLFRCWPAQYDTFSQARIS